jgi:glycosyltransferase involved in cell wall biosynthesis
MKIVVVASLADSLLNFRGPLLQAMVRLGHSVQACAPDHDENIVRGLARIGVEFRTIPMDRVGLNPASDLRTLYALARMFRSETPDLVIAYTQKPIIYAGLAARLAGRGARLIVMVTGLGYVCTGGGGPVRSLVRPLMTRMFRIATGRADRVMVFNSQDAADMRRHGMIPRDREVIQVPGSGVDLSRFAARPLPGGAPIFLMIGRLLRDKGLCEYVEAARQVRRWHPHARFQLLGRFDANPSAVSPADVRRWEDEGAIEYLGSTDDVRPFIERATVFVLPSYREGLPRSTLEAMATGRAIVTTDAPGCRDTVTDGDNGFVVPVGDSAALAVAMARFVTSPDLAKRMGERSREIAEARYGVEQVNAVLLDLMGLAGASTAGGARVRRAQAQTRRPAAMLSAGEP